MVPLRALPGVVRVSLVTAMIVVTASSCRCTKDGRRDESGDAADAGDAAAALPSNVLDDRYEGSGDGPFADGGTRFLDASPKVEIDPDGPVDPVCTGPEIAFARAVVDRRCAIGSARAKALRAALERDSGAPITLRQEAKIESDGRLTVRMINAGTAALTLPLSWSSKLASFTVLAEDERHSIFELGPPSFEVSDEAGAGRGSGASAGPESGRAHFARIVLPPGGAAVATITVDPTIAKTLRRAADAGAQPCTDGGVCTPARLASGRYVLHVGELLTDIEAGPPARVTWDLR